MAALKIFPHDCLLVHQLKGNILEQCNEVKAGEQNTGKSSWKKTIWD